MIVSSRYQHRDVQNRPGWRAALPPHRQSAGCRIATAVTAGAFAAGVPFTRWRLPLAAPADVLQ